MRSRCHVAQLAVVKLIMNETEYRDKRYEKLTSLNPTNTVVLLN